MRLYDIKGTVISTPCYFKAENNGKYMLRLRIRENKPGRTQKGTCWNCILYCTERDFIAKEVEKGDVIQFTGASLKARSTKNRVYLDDNGKTKVKTASTEGATHIDNNGRKYKIDYIDNTTVVAREGKWRLFEKSYEIYQLIVNGTIKMPIEAGDFKNDVLSFELEDDIIAQIRERVEHKLLTLEFMRHKRKAYAKKGVATFTQIEDDFGGKLTVLQIKIIGE